MLTEPLSGVWLGFERRSVSCEVEFLKDLITLCNNVLVSNEAIELGYRQNSKPSRTYDRPKLPPRDFAYLAVQWLQT